MKPSDGGKQFLRVVGDSVCVGEQHTGNALRVTRSMPASEHPYADLETLRDRTKIAFYARIDTRADKWGDQEMWISWNGASICLREDGLAMPLVRMDGGGPRDLEVELSKEFLTKRMEFFAYCRGEIREVGGEHASRPV